MKIIATTSSLYRQYDGQCRPQDCYIEIDLDHSTIEASYNAEIGNSVPMDVWHGISRRFEIPCISPATADALLAELLPLAERLEAGHETVWDGKNYVSHLSQDAQNAHDEIDAICQDVEGEDCAPDEDEIA
jgi:hypothetical protein